jgi:hypothetical protein
LLVAGGGSSSCWWGQTDELPEDLTRLSMIGLLRNGVERGDYRLPAGVLSTPCQRRRAVTLGFARTVMANGLLQRSGVSAIARPSISGWIWISFVVIQLLDGLMTMYGIYLFGPDIEANPIIKVYAAASSPEAAVLGAKVFAVGCGTVLHLTERHRVVAALSALYALAAIGPWVHVLLNAPV